MTSISADVARDRCALGTQVAAEGRGPAQSRRAGDSRLGLPVMVYVPRRALRDPRVHQGLAPIALVAFSCLG